MSENIVKCRDFFRRRAKRYPKLSGILSRLVLTFCHFHLFHFIVVWNIKCQEKRLVTITPSDSWGGAGLLGVTIRLDDYGGAEERLIRVLDVEPSSPAAICGLVEHQDYLLGTTMDSFDSTQTLSQVLHQHVDKVVEVYVYNTDSDVVRVVALMPTYAWGGAGLLGAEVGTGYLHRLPASSLHTIGSSVERKVRWVGMKPVHPAAEQEATLELEPQLEMEVESESHQEDMHKTMQQVADHGTNNGASSTSQPPKKESSEPVVSQAPPVKESAKSSVESLSEKETERPKETPGEPLVPTENSVPAPTQESKPPVVEEQAQEISHPQPDVQQTTTMPPPPVDAAALFAAPPPDATSSTTIPPSYATQFMPPPPMSHLSRDK